MVKDLIFDFDTLFQIDENLIIAISWQSMLYHHLRIGHAIPLFISVFITNLYLFAAMLITSYMN